MTASCIVQVQKRHSRVACVLVTVSFINEDICELTVHWHILACVTGARGPAIKYFTVKANKSQHVILSVPAPLTAALHSQRPSEAQACSHTDWNKWPHLHYFFRLKAKARSDSYWSHNSPQTVGCVLVKNEMLTSRTGKKWSYLWILWPRWWLISYSWLVGGLMYHGITVCLS